MRLGHAIIPAMLVFSGLLTAVATGATLQSLDIDAFKDNTLYETVDGSLSNGLGAHFFAGKTGAAGSNTSRRGVLAFDIAGNLPAGATISHVTLTLHMSRTIADAEDVELHLLTSDWGEGASDAPGQEGGGDSSQTNDATWIHTFYNNSNWTTSGGDFASTASASTSVNGIGYYLWSSGVMIADVQMWLDNPATNYGWILIGDEVNDRTAKRFDSRENAAVDRRPVLTVFYYPAGETTGACCFNDGSCQILNTADCAAGFGTYQGDETDCVLANCPFVPSGACCLDDGACIDDLTTAQCAAQNGAYQGDNSECASADCPVILTPFIDPLPLPAIAQPDSGTVGGAATYTISEQEVQQQLHSELPPTTVWGYNGMYPGPTIEAGMDQQVDINWVNDLREPNGVLRSEHYLPVDLCPHGPRNPAIGNSPRTVVHLHGGHVRADSDGDPEDTLLPGESHLYQYPNHQLPALLWYHDHAIGITRLNVYMGLAGLYIIRDPFEQALDLPTGEFEIPLVIQDRSFHPDGSLKYPATLEEHFFGDKILVNGKIWPFLNVKKGKYRFRVLNGSNARTLTLSLSNEASFTQIGTDGGLKDVPLTITDITLTPAERADLIMDFAAYPTGTEIVLQNSAPAPFPGTPGVGVIPDVMKFVVTEATGFQNPVPSTLRTFTPIPITDAVISRDFVIARSPDDCAGNIWLINGLGWNDITEYPVLGTTEIWNFINDSAMMHPMHMHLVMFQVIDRQNMTKTPEGDFIPVDFAQSPDPREVGWKDTVLVNPNEKVRVIARFEDYTGRFPYHCHILEHEDYDMMRQFQVVLPGDLNHDGIVNLVDVALMAIDWNN